MTGTINGNVITVRQGDSFTLNFQIYKGSEPVNLSGAQLVMQVRDENNQLKWTLYGTGIDANKGKIALLLSPVQTGIAVGEYKTDIQLTTADGSVNTIFPANVNQIGVLRISEQVTEV